MRHDTRRTCYALLWAASLVCSLSGCLGYMVGTQSLYPADIRSIYVPMFHSNSFRRQLGERLTEAVQKEIELKTPFKVVNTPHADSVLTGTLVTETKRILVESPTDEARDVEVNFHVVVTWTDRKGARLTTDAVIPMPPVMADVGANAQLIPEVGRSVATAQQEVIQRLAEQIVAQMERPW